MYNCICFHIYEFKYAYKHAYKDILLVTLRDVYLTNKTYLTMIKDLVHIHIYMLAYEYKSTYKYTYIHFSCDPERHRFNE
jgi:hypothetical protein